ncbi:unnamed protein product, partial [Sphacelaria rigidula]
RKLARRCSLGPGRRRGGGHGGAWRWSVGGDDGRGGVRRSEFHIRLAGAIVVVDDDSHGFATARHDRWWPAACYYFCGGGGGLSPLRLQQQLQRQGQQQGQQKSQSSIGAEMWEPCPSLSIPHPPFLNPSSSNDDANSNINSDKASSGFQRQHHQQQEQYRSRLGGSPHQSLRPPAGMGVGGPEEAAGGGGGGRIGLGTHSCSSSSGEFEATRNGGASNNGGESSGGGERGGGGVSMMEMGSERYHGCGAGVGGSGGGGRIWEGARRSGTGRSFFDFAAFTRAEK